MNHNILELIRGKSAKVEACLMQIIGIIRMLPSGYHRDMQETKAPLLESDLITQQSIKMATMIINNLEINVDICKKAFTQDIFATDRTLMMVKKGVSFRKAYQIVAQNVLDETLKEDPVENIKRKKHCGGTGNLGLDKYEIRMQYVKNNLDKLIKKNETVLKNLMNL